MLDIAYLALTAACMACCVGVIDRLTRSEDPAPAHPAEHTPAYSPEAGR